MSQMTAMKRIICLYIPGKMPKFPCISKKLIEALASAISQVVEWPAMSAFGVKRTLVEYAAMSANDPKRILTRAPS